jgi:hypothetical protein
LAAIGELRPFEQRAGPAVVVPERLARDDTVEVFRTRFRVDDESVARGARDARRVGVA